MLLAIDIGNTNTVFALFEKEKLKHYWRLQTNTGKTEDEYAVFLEPLFAKENISFTAISDVIISSVVPQSNYALSQLCEKYLNITPAFIGENLKDLGVDINLPKPNEVGADRIINVVSVQESYAMPALVIDFGTATTFDVISEQGAFEGGIIAPGPNLSLKALQDAAAKLPKINIEDPGQLIGKDTISAMQSGMFYGYVSMISGLISKLEEEYKTDFKTIIATGGLAELYASEVKSINVIDHDLTLKGLYLGYKRLKKNKIIKSVA